MAAPAESSGLNTPAARSTRRVPAPAAFFRVATSAVETVLSAVTTTWPVASSTYQAMPRTPECATALLAAESRSALGWDGAAGAADGWTRPAATRRPTAPARSWTNLLVGRGLRGFVCMAPPEQVITAVMLARVPREHAEIDPPGHFARERQCHQTWCLDTPPR